MVKGYEKNTVKIHQPQPVKPRVFKGESFRPGMKISSNYKDHTFEVFIYKYQQTPQLTGI